MLQKFLLLFLFIYSSSLAQNFSKQADKNASLLQSGFEKYWCPITGIKLSDYYKTNHAVKLKNGIQRQYCSINSLLKDIKDYGIDRETIQVVDANSLKFIYAPTAYYVIGSKVKGTMSKVSKIAFKYQNDAFTFQKEFGGEVVSFQTALNEAAKTYEEDKKSLNEKKEKELYPKGEKLYNQRCEKIDPNNYLEINELKAEILRKQYCSSLEESELQSIAIFLWEKVKEDSSKEKIQVYEKERCPVCGMYVSKYPQWITQLIYKHKNHEHKFSFAGVKDMMKFYLNPKKWGDFPVSIKQIKEVKVTDYNSQKPIDGKKAFYVLGSNVFGPMKKELIPFKSFEEAETFKKENKGTKIVKLDEILEVALYKLDEDK